MGLFYGHLYSWIEDGSPKSEDNNISSSRLGWQKMVVIVRKRTADVPSDRSKNRGRVSQLARKKRFITLLSDSC